MEEAGRVLGVNRSCLEGVKDIPGREIFLYANKIAEIWVVNVRDRFTPNGSLGAFKSHHRNPHKHSTCEAHMTYQLHKY